MNSNARLAAALLGGALIGFLAIGAVRYATLEPPSAVHYHANWAIFIDGQRLDLTDVRFMEDVAACSSDPAHQDPEHRVHMHENNHDVVHVHSGGVTWGHLMANLGFSLGNDFLYTNRARYETTPEKSLKFVLNGSPVFTVNNQLIGDRDRLLISYGPETAEEVTATQFPLVASSATQYNEMPDPASCSGAVEESTGERLRRAFWIESPEDH